MTEVDKRLEKVRALLAKAEATDYPEEAQALTAKANELMIAWAIDADALADALASAKADPTKIGVVELELPGNPYTMPHATLGANIARAYRCRPIIMDAYGRKRLEVVGLERDVKAVEILYTSLLLQARSELNALLRKGQGKGVAYRNAFMLGFGRRIGERLEEANAAAEAAAVAAERNGSVASGGGTVALALADRSRVVDRAFRERHPRVRTTYSKAGTGNGAWGGRSDGAAAANRANLNANRSGLGQRKSLPA